MTTPARSSSMNLIVEAVQYYAGGSRNTPLTATGVFHQSIRSLTFSRPASTSNKKSSSGWRSPSNWKVDFSDYTPYAPGTVTTTIQQGSDPASYYVYTNSANTYSGDIALPTISSARMNAAVIKALSKLKNQQVNLSVCFGERKEAAEMMVHTVTSIAKQVRLFKNSRPKDWAKVIKNQLGSVSREEALRKVPNSWLEVQYGWKPLMSDVHGAAVALNNRERSGDAYRATVSATVIDHIDYIRQDVIGGGYNGSFDIHVVGNAGYKVRLDYQLENPVLATLSQLGITNPAELVWELVPYSFVVDWFLPVGSYLNALDAALGWSFKGGTGTTFARQQCTSGGVKLSAYWLSFHNRSISGDARYSNQKFSMNRSIFTSSPLPRFPGIKNPLSTGHVANALSLLVSSFR